MKPEDLGKHDCLAYSYSPRSEWRSVQAVWRMTGPDGEISIPFAARLQTDSAEGLRHAALAGMGIVMLPEMVVSKDIEAGRLVRLLPELHATHPTDESPLPARSPHVAEAAQFRRFCGRSV